MIYYVKVLSMIYNINVFPAMTRLKYSMWDVNTIYSRIEVFI